MSCTIKYNAPKNDSQLATRNFLVAKTIIDKFNKILDFTKWSNEAGRLNKIAKDTYNLSENILSSEQQGKVASFNKPMFDEIDRQKSNSTKYQSNNDSGLIASEKTIRDLAARMSDRIGIPFRIISDRTQQFKGKIENNTAIVNLAYATLDTPIHEILGHPIIRAIKGKYPLTNEYIQSEIDITKKLLNKEITKEEANRLREQRDNPTYSELYKNLLKELEYGKGKEVLDRVKRDYKHKDKKHTQKELEEANNHYYKLAAENNLEPFSEEMDEFYKGKSLFTSELYTLEEQQEEAIVELLGLMTAEKLDNVKDGKLISLLKRLLKEIKAFVKSLLKQREVEIDNLPDNMTIGDIADLLAYSNSKLILPGNEVIYTTPDNNKFRTYAEASNYISQLAKNVKDVDLSNVSLNIRKKINNVSEIPVNKFTDEFVGDDLERRNDVWYYEYTNTAVNNDIVVAVWNSNISKNNQSKSNIEGFLNKNKQYEQSKEIIDEWKKVNNIQYNPEEIYSRGQEFSSVVGAYSSFDVNLMMQNLLSHIEDNEKAGGKFAISAYTKPIDRQIGHLEGGGGKIKFKLYPQSNDILWAANTDVYSGSVWDASEKVNKDKKSELLGVSYTKYPNLRNVNSIQPNLASIVDDLSHHHNELAISLNFSNFEIEVDEDVPYQTKKIIENVNKILQQKRLEQINNFINKLEKEC